jgi:hypothetical protein
MHTGSLRLGQPWSSPRGSSYTALPWCPHCDNSAASYYKPGPLYVPVPQEYYEIHLDVRQYQDYSGAAVYWNLIFLVFIYITIIYIKTKKGYFYKLSKNGEKRDISR